MTPNMYLTQIIQKYAPRILTSHAASIIQLKTTLQTWADGCYVAVLDSGSRAKGTAISLASDVDYLVSLKSNCNENSGGLKGIYDSLYTKLNSTYKNVRKQNVSVRINLNGLEVDVTPARLQPASSTYHWIYLSKSGSRQQTSIQRHISDISTSGRLNEIKIIKIWRELNQLDIPSIYLEYLIVDSILRQKPKAAENLGDNVWHVFNELASDVSNPLFTRVADPANTNNILSDLLTVAEKNAIIARAKVVIKQQSWDQIVW